MNRVYAVLLMLLACIFGIAGLNSFFHLWLKIFDPQSGSIEIKSIMGFTIGTLIFGWITIWLMKMSIRKINRIKTQ